MICQYIETKKEEFGAWPICKVLTGAGVKIAPSTYYARRSRPPSARSLRDETLKAEISKVHKNQLLGAGARKMHVMRGRPEIAERHGAGHVARCTARAAHGRPGPTRCQTRQVAQNDALGSKGPVPGRPRQKACQRVQAERAVGRRHSPASGRCPPPMYASSPGGSMWLS